MKIDRKVDGLVDELLPRATEFLAEIVRFPSTQGKEAECQEAVATAFSDLGLEVEKVEIPEELVKHPEYSSGTAQAKYKGRPNVLVNLAGSGRGRSLILNTHVDVVPAPAWAEAFTPRLKDGRMTGRGAADAKASVATLYLVHVVLAKLKPDLAGDVLTQLVIEEEVGGNGTLALIEQGYRADAAVVLEVTDLALHPSNRGGLWFRIEIDGVSCHMARAGVGVSAIDHAIEAINELKKFEAEQLKQAAKHPLFKMHKRPVPVNVGTLNAGGWPSMVPGKAVLEGGLGFLPEKSISQVKKELEHLLKNSKDRWLAEHFRLSFQGLHNEGFTTDVDHPLVTTMREAMKGAGLDNTPTGWISACDARLYAKLAKMPVVVFGPGKLDCSHGDNEYVDVADIGKAAKTLARLVLDWCD